jgi:hypothetical protein
MLDNFKNYLNIQEVGIVHSTTPDEAQTLRCRLSALLDKNKIYVSRLGPALGVHGGPGTLVLALREGKIPAGREEKASEKTRRVISLPSFHVPKLNMSRL